jgi:hypothetical protein
MITTRQIEGINVYCNDTDIDCISKIVTNTKSAVKSASIVSKEENKEPAWITIRKFQGLGFD